MLGWKLNHVGKRGNWWLAWVMDWSSSFKNKAAQFYTHMNTYLYKLTQYENIYHFAFHSLATWARGPFGIIPTELSKSKKSKTYYLQKIIETEPAFNSKLNIFLVMMRQRKNVYLSYHHYMIFRITTGARHLVSLLDYLFDWHSFISQINKCDVRWHKRGTGAWRACNFCSNMIWQMAVIQDTHSAI